MKLPSVISVGAGQSQILLIKSIRKLGYNVISIDQDPEAIGFNCSDRCLHLSTYEPQPIIKALLDSEENHDIKGVFTRSSGPPVITTAVLAEHFDLPGATAQAASLVVNKKKFMKVCQQQNIKTPNSRQIDESNYLEVVKSRLPCVIKPALGLVGKAGVTLVKSLAEAKLALQVAQTASYNNNVLAEEFIPGEDIGFMSVVFKGRVYPVVLLRELNEFRPDGMLQSKGLSIPCSLGADTDKLIYSLAQDTITAAGIEYGPFLMSCRCTEGKYPTLIEAHLDFGGDNILDTLFPLSTNFDFVTYVLKVMLHIRSPALKKDPEFKYAFIDAMSNNPAN
jgi:carbamoylphosphate synthase large subunit